MVDTLVCAALLAFSAACLAGPDSRLAAKSLARGGDRFIQLQPSSAGNRFVNIASELTVLYSEGVIEVRPRGANALRYEFASANPSVPQGVNESGVTYNFFVGARERWATGLRSYSQVAYRGLWPGIEATYSGDAGGIKYHFDVGAGANAAAITFIVRGAEAARIAKDGAVEWSVGGKRLRDERPVAFQASASGDAIVPAAFTLEAAGPGAWRLGFEVGAYDRARALTLDPAWTAYSGLVGGNAADQVYGVARDASDNSYACGVTASTDLPALSAYDATANGGDDAFLVKFNASGAPQFVTYFGGSGFDACTGIALSAADGTIHVAGGTTSTNFPFAGTGDSSFRRSKATTDRDAFVAKFGAAGSTLTFSGVIGGTSDDQAMAIALDASGRAYVAGYSTGNGFPFVGGPASFAACSTCAFVARINTAGTATEYSGSLLGNGSVQSGRGIAIATDNSAYVAGETNSTSGLPSTSGTFRTVPGGGEGDGFVAKVGPTGSSVFFTLLTGTTSGAQSGVDRALGIAIDTNGALVVVGETDSGSFPADDAGTQLGSGSGLQNAPTGNMDGFVVRLAGDGSSVVARSYVGGSRFDSVEAVALDGAGGAYVAGTTSNTNSAGGGANGFPTAATTGLGIANLGQQDGFIGRILSTIGSAFSGFVGSGGNDTMHAITASPNSILALGGATTVSSGLTNTTTGALSASPSATNGLVLRVNPYGPPATLTIVSGTPQSTNVNSAFGAPLRVKIADADGIGLAGVNVTFTPPASGASASLSPASPVATDASGFAQVAATANAVAGGPYNITASASGLSSVDFSLTNLTPAGAPRSGFNGDARSDVFWRDSTGGLNYQWQMNGFTVSGLGYMPSVPASWTVAGIGDVNGNGIADVFWRETGGLNYLWLMNGFTVASQGYLPTVPNPWTVLGLGDASGDGKADIFWRNPATGQNYLWIMNGLAISSQAYLPTVAGTDWEVVGVADYNGDARADVLWRNKATGQNYLWVMNGLAVSSQGYLPTVTPTDWEVVGSPDANADGKADVLWRNKVTGQNYLWLMNGFAIATQGYLPSVADVNWKVVGSGDYNGDGRGDVLWRNAASGQNYLWTLNGISVAVQGYLPSVAGANWQPVK